MSLQSERLLNHMLRLRLSHLPNCYEAIAEEASAKNLPYLDFLEQRSKPRVRPSTRGTSG